jgi:hypothetical protein
VVLLPSEKYDFSPPGFAIKEVCLRASSFKLVSSSLYFQAMLPGLWFPEAEMLKRDGLVEVQLLGPEDSPTAITIILGTLYDKEVQVPRRLKLALLEKIAVLVDKYQWHITPLPAPN